MWWIIDILHRWDCRASFTALQQSYNKHMQRKQERTHDATQHRILNSPRQHDGKGSVRLMLMRIPFRDHCSTHTWDAHIPLGWSKERKCESCQPIGDWVIEEFDSERNILLPWWWTRRNDNWIYKQSSRREILKERLHGKGRPSSFKNPINSQLECRKKRFSHNKWLNPT